MKPRQLVSCILQYSAANAVALALRRNTLTVLCYHRILDSTDPERESIDPALVTSTHVFERQMQAISRQFNPITLSDAIHWLDGQRSLPPRTVLITFDDGVSDTYSNAFPVMRRYGIPGAVFLATGFIDTPKRHWTDVVHEQVAALSGNDAAAAEVERLKRMPSSCRQEALETSGSHTPAGATRCGNLTWDEIGEMSRHGFEFGSHTRNHLILPHEPDETIWRELTGAADDIRLRLGHYPISFAYPDGQFDDRSVRLVRQSGCRAAFTCDEGFANRRCNRLALPRILMHDGISAAHSGDFCRALFVTCLAGTIPRRYKRGVQ